MTHSSSEICLPRPHFLGPFLQIFCNFTPFAIIKGLVRVRIWCTYIGLMDSAGGVLGYKSFSLVLKMPLFLRLLSIALFRLSQWDTFGGFPRQDIRVGLWQVVSSPSPNCFLLAYHLLLTRWQGSSTSAPALSNPAFASLIFALIIPLFVDTQKSCQYHTNH